MGLAIALHRQHADQRHLPAEADRLDRLRRVCRGRPLRPRGGCVPPASSAALAPHWGSASVVDGGVGAELATRVPASRRSRTSRSPAHRPPWRCCSASSDTPPVPISSTVWPRCERAQSRHQRVPRGHAGAGQRRRLLEAQRAGQLAPRPVAGSVTYSASMPLAGGQPSASPMRGRRRSLEPALEEGAGHPISGREGGDAAHRRPR